MGKLYKELKKGLEEVIAHKKGRILLKSELIEIPESRQKYSLKTSKRTSAKNASHLDR
jgi:hypothetical protein